MASAVAVCACHVVCTTRSGYGEQAANKILLGTERCLLVVRTDEYVISGPEIFFAITNEVIIRK